MNILGGKWFRKEQLAYSENLKLDDANIPLTYSITSDKHFLLEIKDGLASFIYYATFGLKIPLILTRRLLYFIAFSPYAWNAQV